MTNDQQPGFSDSAGVKGIMPLQFCKTCGAGNGMHYGACRGGTEPKMPPLDCPECPGTYGQHYPDCGVGADEWMVHRAVVTGTSMDGGWHYAACSCGWKEGTTAHQSPGAAHDAWRLHVESIGADERYRERTER